ncbi:hypothetical protein ACE6H2_024908 [Prunus campanulata]
MDLEQQLIVLVSYSVLIVRLILFWMFDRVSGWGGLGVDWGRGVCGGSTKGGWEMEIEVPTLSQISLTHCPSQTLPPLRRRRSPSAAAAALVLPTPPIISSE